MPSVFRSWSPSHKWILCGFFVGSLHNCKAARFVLRFAFWASLLQATQTLGFWELLLFLQNCLLKFFLFLSYFETSPSFARSLSLSFCLLGGRRRLQHLLHLWQFPFTAFTFPESECQTLFLTFIPCKWVEAQWLTPGFLWSNFDCGKVANKGFPAVLDGGSHRQR